MTNGICNQYISRLNFFFDLYTAEANAQPHKEARARDAKSYKETHICEFVCSYTNDYSDVSTNHHVSSFAKPIIPHLRIHLQKPTPSPTKKPVIGGLRSPTKKPTSVSSRDHTPMIILIY
jgi:hypothetical protein